MIFRKFQIILKKCKRFTLLWVAHFILRFLTLWALVVTYEVVVVLFYDKRLVDVDSYLWLLTWTQEIDFYGTLYILIILPFQVWAGKFDMGEDARPRREVTWSQSSPLRKRKSWKEVLENFTVSNRLIKFALLCLKYFVLRLLTLGALLVIYEVVVFFLHNNHWIDLDYYSWLLTWTYEIGFNGTVYLLIITPFQVWAGKLDADEDVQPPREVTSPRHSLLRKRKSWKETLEKSTVSKRFIEFALLCLKYFVLRLLTLGALLVIYEVLASLAYDNHWIDLDYYSWLLMQTHEIVFHGTVYLLIIIPFQVWAGKFDADEDVQPPREVTSPRLSLLRKRKSWKDVLKKFFRLLP
jgi:hypothetical protein